MPRVRDVLNLLRRQVSWRGHRLLFPGRTAWPGVPDVISHFFREDVPLVNWQAVEYLVRRTLPDGSSEFFQGGNATVRWDETGIAMKISRRQLIEIQAPPIALKEHSVWLTPSGEVLYAPHRFPSYAAAQQIGRIPVQADLSQQWMTFRPTALEKIRNAAPISQVTRYETAQMTRRLYNLKVKSEGN